MNYDHADEVIALKFPEDVRTRPHMYIGPTDNPNVVFREIVDNSIDECFSSENTNAILLGREVLMDDNVVYFVVDNGRGIPIKMDPEEGMTKTQLAMGTTHAGSKFHKKSIAIGMNGVGASVTNALSERFIVFSKIHENNWDSSIDDVKDLWLRKHEDQRKSLYYVIEFRKGILYLETAMDLALEDYDEFLGPNCDLVPLGFSTYTFFIPDLTIFKSAIADVPKMNLINTKTIFKLFFDRQVNIFYNKEEITETREPFKFTVKRHLELQKGYTNEFVKILLSFEFDPDLGNSTGEGSINSSVSNTGMHMVHCNNLISEALRTVYNLTYRNLTPGLNLYVILLAPEVEFHAQVKDRLVGVPGLFWQDLLPLKEDVVKIIRENKAYFDQHVARLVELNKVINDLKAIDMVKSMVRGLSDPNNSRSWVPEKVLDASSAHREECELFIVEGRSAGDQMAKSRNPLIHAILPLRGKPVNSMNYNLDMLFENQEMKDIIAAIGVGTEEFHDLSRPRYGKIVISADADPDGMAISALICGLFAQHLPFLIRAGMLYISECPLYFQNGTYYYPSDKDVEVDKTQKYTRFKGLGEMNPDQLKHVFYTHETRRLRKVVLEGVDHAFGLLTSRIHRKQLMVSHGLLIDKHKLW